MKIKNEYFRKFYARVAKEGWLKSVFCGLCAGFCANFLAAAAVWLIRGKHPLWIPITAGIAVAAAAIPLFYFRRFRPSDRDVARRMDALGMDERMVTMLELQDDDSYIAIRQRNDAKERMRTTDVKGIRFRFSKVSLILLAVFAVLGVSMTMVTGLSAAGKAPDGSDFIDNLLPEQPVDYVSVSYVVEEGGIIEGEADQLIPVGTDAETVVAVADDGWMFAGWDDGGEDPSRTDAAIMEDMIFTAMFQRVEESEDGSGGDGDSSDDSEPSDRPSDPGDGDGSSASDPSDPSSGNGSGGTASDNDKVIDGETYYRDILEAYYQKAMEMIANGEEVPESIKAIIQAYYGIIL